MRLGVDRPTARQTGLLLRRQGDIDFTGDAPGNFALQCQDVPNITFVGLPPELFLGRRPNKLGSDPHSIANAYHRPFDDRVDVQLPPDRRQWLPGLLVGHHRGAGDDSQRRDLGDVRNQLVRHPVGKVVLRRVTREVLQRQHRDRANRNLFSPETLVTAAIATTAAVNAPPNTQATRRRFVRRAGAPPLGPRFVCRSPGFRAAGAIAFSLDRSCRRGADARPKAPRARACASPMSCRRRFAILLETASHAACEGSLASSSGSPANSGSRSRIAAIVSDVVSPANGRRPDEHLVEHAPERPDIGPLVDRLARAPARGSCTPPCPGSRPSRAV